MKNTLIHREVLILLAFMGAILLFPALIQLIIAFIYSFWNVQPGPIMSNVIYLLPNVAMLGIALWFLHLDQWDFASIGAKARKIFPGLVFTILALVGLYVILPIGTALFFEPKSLYVTAQTIDMDYALSFLSTWVVAGVCIAFMAWGYLLNKTYSVLDQKMADHWKKILSVVLISVFFTLLHVLRFQIAKSTSIGFGTVLFVFLYCVFCSYLYLRTQNLFVPAFMQAAYAFPPLGLTVGGKLVLKSFGFIVPMVLLFAFIVLLAETYGIWGKPLEFEKEESVASS
ncbi:MAG: hypothetical protein PHI40_04540 [Caldisericia bacterium]|nr:hypothetical protein [Caldisericia bacterium]MDD4614661.1 hypothetical protein [Caldisericia bacterium]